MNLLQLIIDETVGIEKVAEHLDGLSHEQRSKELGRLGRKAQRILYMKAAHSPPIALDHFVPSDRLDLESVSHEGKNTLPLPSNHQRFIKAFCRPPQGRHRLFGYNDAPSRRLVGPGYFVAVSTAGHAAWSGRGGVVVDYFQVPDGPVASDWPRIVANTRGLQRFVYYGTRDFMRKVSTHVSIGAAFKGEKPLDHYFVLCRPR